MQAPRPGSAPRVRAVTGLQSRHHRPGTNGPTLPEPGISDGPWRYPLGSWAPPASLSIRPRLCLPRASPRSLPRASWGLCPIPPPCLPAAQTESVSLVGSVWLGCPEASQVARTPGREQPGGTPALSLPSPGCSDEDRPRATAALGTGKGPGTAPGRGTSFSQRHTRGWGEARRNQETPPPPREGQRHKASHGGQRTAVGRVPARPDWGVQAARGKGSCPQAGAAWSAV